MTKFIAVLRGINVGGKRKILMTDLKRLLEKYDYKNSTTYIQSGNVAFFSSKNATEIQKEIKDAIFIKYGFDVPVIVRTATEIERVFKNNPFLLKESDISKLYVAFLSEIPSNESLEKLNAIHFSDANYSLVSNQLYICYDTKCSDSKLTNNLIEKKLNVTATTRNWKTVTKLFEFSDS